MNEQMKNETHAESYGDGQVVWSVILLYFFGIYWVYINGHRRLVSM